MRAMPTVMIAFLAITSATVAEAQSNRCGLLVEWTLPTQMRIYSVPGDTAHTLTVTTKARLNNILRVAELFCRVRGRYPATLTDMRQFSAARSDPSLCVFDWDSGRDAWGRPIYYGMVSGTVVVASAGEDGLFGTTDDVGVPSATGGEGHRIDLHNDCSI